MRRKRSGFSAASVEEYSQRVKEDDNSLQNSPYSIPFYGQELNESENSPQKKSKDSENSY